MLEYNNQLIEIIKWDKYNPRKDLKATSWVRLQNSLFGDPEFIEFNHSELLFWIYLLSLASQKQIGSIHFKQRHAEEVGRFSKQDIHSAIQKLVEMNCIKVSVPASVKVTESTLRARDVDVTQTLRGCDADDTLRTNERNERNVTNERYIDDTDTHVPERVRLDFESVYEEYPRKEGKQKGLDLCKAKIKTQEDYEKLLCSVRRYRAHCDKVGTQREFIKHFSSFISSGSWKDWADPETGTSLITHKPQTTNRAELRSQNNQAVLEAYQMQLNGVPDESKG